MTRVEFLDIAKIELREAIAYDESESAELGREFTVEVKRTLERIIRFPEAWSMLSERTRRCRTKRFPYGIVYQVRKERILIVAIMHLRREPDGWRGRLRPDELP